MEIHIQKDFRSFGGPQIQEIVKIVAAMLECVQTEILVVDARPSGSVILVLSVKEEYAWKFTALNKEDCQKLRRLKIDYLIVDKNYIPLETSTGICFCFFICLGFFLGGGVLGFSPATFDLTRIVLVYFAIFVFLGFFFQKCLTPFEHFMLSRYKFVKKSSLKKNCLHSHFSKIVK